jgi:hypothetical protein
LAFEPCFNTSIIQSAVRSRHQCPQMTKLRMTQVENLISLGRIWHHPGSFRMTMTPCFLLDPLRPSPVLHYNHSPPASSSSAHPDESLHCVQRSTPSNSPGCSQVGTTICVSLKTWSAPPGARFHSRCCETASPQHNHIFPWVWCWYVEHV